jgi:hypothetical protein
VARSEWEGWPVRLPPTDFADRVDRDIARHRSVARRVLRRRVAIGVAVAAAAAAAAAVLVVRGRGVDATGDVTARGEPREVRIGTRAVAVLQQGAHVTWNGGDVTQDVGDAFYRVDRGDPFVVHTPAGDVGVRGTCFWVRMGEAGGAGATSPSATVTVLEGKVLASRATGSIALAAGESARLDPSGVHPVALGSSPAVGAAMAAAANPAGPGAPQATAVGERVESLEAENARLEQALREARRGLATRPDAGSSAALTKNPVDLTPDDWTKLAKDGLVRYQFPCAHTTDWAVPADAVAKLGLSPDDAKALKAAYARSNQRVWAAVRPTCSQALGSAEAADTLGLNSCTHVVVVLAAEKDELAAAQAMRVTAEIRSGQRPSPQPDEAVDPLERMLLALTGEMGAFEQDLAQSLGPDEAHRFASDETLCMTKDTWGP